LADAQANKKEQKLQAEERLAAAASRRSLLTFIPKADAEIDQLKDWREKSVQTSTGRVLSFQDKAVPCYLPRRLQ